MRVCEVSERAAWDTLEQTLLDAHNRHCSELHIEFEPDCIRLRHLMPAGFEESRLPAGDPIHASMHALRHLLWPLSDTPQSRSGWFQLPMRGESFLYRLDAVSTANGHSYVMQRLHSTQRPQPNLDDVVRHSGQLEHFRKLLKRPNGLVLLANHKTSNRFRICRAIAQSLISPESKIVMAEQDFHPLAPRTTQIVLPAQPTPEQQNAWQMSCDMSANVIISAMTEHATNTLASKACEDCLVIQGVSASSAAQTLKRLLAAGIKPEVIAPSIQAIVSVHQMSHLCEDCKVPRSLSDTESEWLGQYSPMREGAIKDWLNERLSDTFFEALGCSSCYDTGTSKLQYHMQITEVSRDVRDALYEGDVRFALRLLHDTEQLPQLLLKQAQLGHITLSEAMRISQATP